MTRVGLIGCGLIANWMHLPNLLEIDDVEVIAVSDLNEDRLRSTQSHCRIQIATSDYRELLRLPELGAVIIATEDVSHAELAIAALSSGKHVFLEKPMCMTHAESTEIRRLVRETGLILMVGYHKVYDPAVELARGYLELFKDLRLIHIQDICHDNALVLEEILPEYMKTDEFRAGQTDFALTRRWTETAEVLFPGMQPSRQRRLRLLLNLACHDMSILVHLFGEPVNLEFAEVWSEEPFALAVFGYGNSVKCIMELGQTKRKWFDERLILYGANATLRIQWPSPFLKNSPTLVFVDQMRGLVEEHVRYVAGYSEAFRKEMRIFLECIQTGVQPPTSVDHGKVVLDWTLKILGSAGSSERMGNPIPVF